MTSVRKLTWSLNNVSISVMLFPLLTRIVHSLKFLRAVSRFWCSAAVLDSFVILRIGILSLSYLLFLCPFTPLFLYYSIEKNIGWMHYSARQLYSYCKIKVVKRSNIRTDGSEAVSTFTSVFLRSLLTFLSLPTTYSLRLVPTLVYEEFGFPFSKPEFSIS